MDTATETAVTEAKRPRQWGRPFKPGENANPHGRRVTQALAEKLVAEMADDFEPLSVTDGELLLQACVLLIRGRRTADPDMAIRLSGTALRLINSLRHKRKHTAKPKLASSLADHLAQTAGEPE